MRKLFILILALNSSAIYAQRQVDKNTDWSLKERMYFGVGLGGLGFGNNYFSLGLTPQVGYMIAKDFSGGLAIEYQYIGYPSTKTKRITYGGYPYLRYNIKQFFIQTDYDWYSIDDIYTPAEDRKIYNRFMVGAGYFSQGGGRSAVNFLLSYDFLYSTPSQFNSPVDIRIFITF